MVEKGTKAKDKGSINTDDRILCTPRYANLMIEKLHVKLSLTLSR